MLIGSKAQITDLRASQGRSIIFYDPISFQPEAGTGGTLTEADGTLKINAPDPLPEKSSLPSMGRLIIRAEGDGQPTSKSYTGTVVFSGKSTTKAKEVTNIFLFPSPVELTAGRLVFPMAPYFLQHPSHRKMQTRASCWNKTHSYKLQTPWI